MTRQGFEPLTSRFRGGRSKHSATVPALIIETRRRRSCYCKNQHKINRPPPPTLTPFSLSIGSWIEARAHRTPAKLEGMFVTSCHCRLSNLVCLLFRPLIKSDDVTACCLKYTPLSPSVSRPRDFQLIDVSIDKLPDLDLGLVLVIYFCIPVQMKRRLYWKSKERLKVIVFTENCRGRRIFVWIDDTISTFCKLSSTYDS